MSETPRPHAPVPDRTDPGTPSVRGQGDSTADRPHAENRPTLSFQPAWSEAGGLVGQVFGDFELTEELGRGGMGVVYKAIQRSLGRPVALKLLLGEYAGFPRMLSRFLAEARAVASLTHPNIISIYQVGEGPAGPYFVMEFIDGPSLEQVLKRKPLPIPWVVALMTTVAEAVHHAHEKGIIHRDLKPANIMLHQKKRPVVMDFGIAKNVGSESGNLTSPGALLGTPAFMSPEQAGEEPSKIGPHSDVYSLGAILYTLLTGRPPFEEETALKTILKVIAPDPPPPVRTLRAEVPPRLEQIVMKCLQKESGRRYPSAHALAAELERVRAAQQPGPPPSGSVHVAFPTVALLPEQGKPIRLANPVTVIGRSAECEIVLKVSEVSKKHCRILLGHHAVHVEDLDSVNGTLVNEEPLEARKPFALSDGDQLDIGGELFTVRVKKAP